jgi:hypothetical protein
MYDVYIFLDGRKEDEKYEQSTEYEEVWKEGEKKLRDYGENEFCMKVLLEGIFLPNLHLSWGPHTPLVDLYLIVILGLDDI